jgi:regulator of extracellular matrix RemA (YlzA/DUF370 family)
MIDIGFRNYIDEIRVTSVMEYNNSRARWFIREAIASNRLINCTQGKKAQSVIVLDTCHIVLSSLKYLSIKNKLKELREFNRNELLKN